MHLLSYLREIYVAFLTFDSTNCSRQGSAHTGPALTPAEVLIAIHEIIPEKDKVPLKKVTWFAIVFFNAISWYSKIFSIFLACTNRQSFFPSTLFTFQLELNSGFYTQMHTHASVNQWQCDVNFIFCQAV